MSNSTSSNFVNPRILKLNVGFVLAQNVGYQRTLDLDLPRVRLEDDTELDYLRGTLRLSRNTKGVLLQGILQTTVLVDCARCLTPTNVSVEFEIEELFSSPASPDTVYSVDDAGNIDLAPLIREEAILSTPMGVLCRSDCAGLCAECGQNLNEGSCDCEEQEIDPRLAILRTLRDEVTNTDTE